MSDQQRNDAELVSDQLCEDQRELAEESEALDEVARRLWSLLDRVILFKIVVMPLNDLTAVEA